MRKRDGSAITYTYDNLNRMTRKTMPDRASLAATHERDVYYGYDVRNLMTYARFDSSAGEGVTQTYDGFGRMLTSNINMDSVRRTLSYEYDLGSRRTRITHPNGQAYTYDFDDAARLEGLYEGTVVTAAERLMAFTYTPRGQVDARTEAGGAGVDHDYDPIGRLTSMAHVPGRRRQPSRSGSRSTIPPARSNVAPATTTPVSGPAPQTSAAVMP